MVELMPETVEEEVLQNVRMLTGIIKGEVPLARTLGVDADLVDAPVQQVQAALLSEIAEQVSEYEPRALIKSLKIEGDAAEGRLEPVLELEVQK